MEINELLHLMIERDASDLHLKESVEICSLRSPTTSSYGISTYKISIGERR